uniref:Connector enhancer of KSR protein CNK n=1 Tax=Drosophila melanogaster TaxID=7227 RepID=Q7KNQ9_DROME|eukprot:NP_001286524.1 connector enhancer of ksr, isoform B [Drosophila melanogaster]
MAYINIAEWTPDQVTDWIKGLDESMKGYLYEFSKQEIGGRALLNIRPYELENLGMLRIGHQEIVLEAVENLRNFHYHLKNDNLQFMALHVATAAKNLHRELARNHAESTKIDTRILHDITRTIATLKPLVGSLERTPFRKQEMYREYCGNVLKCGLELATIAHRDRFALQPVPAIRQSAERLENLANFVIQDISDPMVLQPASLNLVTLKKRESELGFNIESSYNGIHRVTDIKYNSPAHNSGKIEDGDEIVQINYQTVVGWQHRTVLEHLREALPDVVLTVKKRPKHTKMFGQIYMQPYRLPSKKRNMAARWAAQMPSPRAAFLTLDTEQLATGGTGSAVPDPSKSLSSEKREVLTKANPVSSASDSDSSCSDIPTPTDPKLAAREIRLYYPKPRALLQRRNTICGCEYLSLKNSDLVVPSWHERKPGIGSPTNCDPGSPSIRDKSISFGYGLEMAARPTTCIGIAGDTSTDKARRMFHEARKLKQLTEDSQREFLVDRYKPGVSKVVRFDAKEDYVMKNEKFICNVENTILETFEPIPFADEGDEDALETLRNCKTENAEELLEAINLATKGQDLPLAEAINMPLLQQGRRGRLDKSHSTPAYDNSGEESDTPPAIEPRKEFLLVTPPAPPPRPRKQREMTPPAVPPPPPKPASMQPASSITSISIPVPVPVPAAVDPSEISELHTPSKSRTLTLKKKHSLMAKRRNTNLKLLGTGDIQGHLYRRKKNHRGVTYWARIYFVMLDTILYGFRSKQSTSASLVIFLPGFTVSLAKEVHSKPHAFKVYHTAKSFYFAAESLDALNQWVDFLRQASLKVPPSTGSKGGGDAKDLYSENDSSGEECDALVIQNLSTPSPQGNKESMSMSMTLSGGTPPSSAPIKHERGYLDSFRKFTNTFKSSAAKPSSDIPVPTEQYRSYRKVPGGSFGIQIGANTPGYHDPAMPPTQIPPLVGPKLSRSSSRSSVVSGTESAVSLSASILGPPASPAPTPTPTATPTSLQHQSSEESPSQSQSQSPSSKSSLKKAPFNFLHASNPNLVEFDFHTSKTLLPKMSVGNTLDHGHNIQGFVTLKDLMLRKQEEEAQEMYNNRVHLGVEKHKHARTESTASQQSAMSSSVTKPLEKLPKIQSVSLPKTPDYEISFKPDDESIKRTRTKEGQKLRDFGYELICGDEPSTSSISRQEHHHHHHHHQHHLQHVQQQQQLQHQQTQQQHSSKAKHFLRSQQLQLSSFLHKNSSGGSGKSSGSGADQKKSKGKSSGDRRFPFSKHSTGSAGSGCGPGHAMTMTLPLNKKSKSNHALDGAVGNGVTIIGSGSSIKKSQTYNQDLRDKIVGTKYDAHRKNSAPIPIFSKLSISGGTPAKPSKENRFLGSPLLHRTLFGHHHHQQQAVTPPSSADPDCDQEIFSQITLPTHNQAGYRSYRGPGILTTSTTNLCSSEGLQPPLPPAPPPPVNTSRQREEEQAEATISECAATPKVSSSGSVDSKAATPDYPNMECPPVFEPEIYSLSDTSLSRIVMRTPSSSGATSATASTTTTNNNNNNNNTNNNTNTNSSPSGGEHHQT